MWSKGANPLTLKTHLLIKSLRHFEATAIFSSKDFTPQIFCFDKFFGPGSKEEYLPPLPPTRLDRQMQTVGALLSACLRDLEGALQQVTVAGSAGLPVCLPLSCGDQDSAEKKQIGFHTIQSTCTVTKAA